MAEETNKTTDEAQPPEPRKEKKEKPSQDAGDAKSGGLRTWILLGIGVVVVAGGAGAATGWLLNSGPEETAGVGPAGMEAQGDEEQKEYEYYPFEAVTVNLNVRRGNRYLKIKMFLAVAQGETKEIYPQIDEKQKELKDWLMGYLRDHTLEEVTGKKNQVRIQREIAQSFNERLWPEGRPHIDHVLFDEFTVQ
jgi:flagellar basal body-associated protein FliL